MKQAAILVLLLFAAIMSTVNGLITKLIAENRVMLFTKSYCPYCAKAKQLFKDLNVAFGDLELDKASDGQSIQNELFTMTGQKTVPNIFINGKHIGGCDTVTKLNSENKLMPLINGESK